MKPSKLALLNTLIDDLTHVVGDEISGFYKNSPKKWKVAKRRLIGPSVRQYGRRLRHLQIIGEDVRIRRRRKQTELDKDLADTISTHLQSGDWAWCSEEINVEARLAEIFKP